MKKILKKPIVIILLLTIIPLVTLIFILSETPIHSLIAFFTGPFTNLYTFGNMLNKSTPLMLTSLGAYIALRSNSFNLGGEGQVYLGAALSCILPIILPSLNIFTVIIIAAILPAIATFISGLLEIKYKINSLISTYLVSMILIKICNYLISGPFLKTDSNILGTNEIPDNFKLLKILRPSSLSIGVFIAIIVVVIISIAIDKTIWGLKFTLSGNNNKHAELMGISSNKYKLTGLGLSGALHGLAGALFVFGSLHSIIVDSYIGLGWNGLSSGLLAGTKPIYVIFTSLFFSYLDSGAQYATVVSDVTLELAVIVKSLIFFVISSRLIKNHFIKRGKI